MADRLPLVFDGTEIERLQSGDGLVDTDGHGYADSESDFSAQGFVIQTANTSRGIEETAIKSADVVTAADAFGTDDVLIVSNGTAKGVEASSIAASEVVVDSDIANMVQSSSTFSAAGLLTQTADTSRGIEETSIETADVVTAASAFGTDEALIVADGTGKGTKASIITESDVSQAFDDIDAAEQDIDDIEADYVSAASAFGTDNVVLRADGTGRGAQLTGVRIDDNNHLILVSDIGTENIVIGDDDTYDAATGGIGNVVIGARAMSSAVSLNSTVAIGRDALASLTTGGSNTAVGREALTSLTSGARNFALAANSLQNLTSGGGNFALGNQALFNLATGDDNFAAGVFAARKLESGDDNVFIGGEAGDNASQDTSVSGCVVIGPRSYTTGDNAIAIGPDIEVGENEVRIGNVTQTSVFFPGILGVTSDPVSAGRLWVEDGFVRISDGSIAPQVFDGFVEGPDGATDNALCVWDGATGKLAKDSTVDVDDVVTAASAFGTDGVAIVADGTGKGVKAGYPAQTRFETYGAGTAYSVTSTPAAIDMGTTDPVIVLTTAGTYRVRAWAEWTDDTNASIVHTITLTIRRTNNTAEDLANGTTSVRKETNSVSHGDAVYWEASEYVTANTDDSITIFVSENGTHSTTINRCWIKAERLS